MAAGVGAWGLVSTFGTASTGAMISGLTGAAARSATLAWFGGGAVAAGGGGMALDAVVLGSICIAPAVIAGAWYLNSTVRDKLRLLNENISNLEAELGRIRRSTEQCHGYKQ